MKFNLYTLLLICFLKISAQEIPPIQQFKSKISFAGNQNWMISQDQKGTLYIANNKGLLQFRGYIWSYLLAYGKIWICNCRSVKWFDHVIGRV